MSGFLCPVAQWCHLVPFFGRVQPKKGAPFFSPGHWASEFALRTSPKNRHRLSQPSRCFCCGAFGLICRSYRPCPRAKATWHNPLVRKRKGNCSVSFFIQVPIKSKGSNYYWRQNQSRQWRNQPPAPRLDLTRAARFAISQLATQEAGAQKVRFWRKKSSGLVTSIGSGSIGKRLSGFRSMGRVGALNVTRCLRC